MYSASLQSMKLFLCLASVLFAQVGAGQDAGQFFNPPNADEALDFSANLVYPLGTTQTIKFTTIYQNYAINLWQQIQGERAATRGPSIFSTEDGAVTQFDWQVQLYQFDLSASNVFFLWLTSNSLNDDGSDPMSVTSHYFNISDNSETPGSSTTPRSTRAALSTQLSSTSLSPSSASRTPTAVSPMSTTSETSTISPTAGGLSTGAQAGIGVGVALAGLAIIIIAFLVFRRWRMKPKYRAHDQPQVQGIFSGGDMYETQGPSFQDHKLQSSVAELGYDPVNGHGGTPVELPAERNYS
ncbi:hypothetical protein GGR55DRAFT_619560 [Xylaria sp. FL0064]|nr:hypothetical protein GGR55DRAFT_619560 [Xylaria sp. FL0064]